MLAKRLEREVDAYLKDTCMLERYKSASTVGRGRGGERPAKRMEREIYAYLKDTRTFERHRSASPVGRGRGGERTAKRDKRDVDLVSGRKTEVFSGNPKHTKLKGKENASASSSALKRSKGNRKCCLTTEDVSECLAAHIVPPRVVQMNHSPSTQTQTHSGTRRDPPYGHRTAVSSTQLRSRLSHISVDPSGRNYVKLA